MSRITAPTLPIVSNHTSTAIWNPLTPALPTVGLRNVRVRIWVDGADLEGARTTTVLPCVQFSNDGISWASSEEVFGSGSYVTLVDDSWMWLDGTATPDGGYTDLFGGGFSPKRFARFGLRALNGLYTDLQSAQCRMVVEAQPVVGRTLRFAPTRVYTPGNATWGNEYFFPTSAPIRTEELTEVRSTLWMEATTGDVTIGAGLQTTDTPEDPSSWTTWGTLWGTRSSVGVSFGTTFTTLGASQQADNWARFGVMAKNTSGSTHESALATLHVDMRRA